MRAWNEFMGEDGHHDHDAWHLWLETEADDDELLQALMYHADNMFEYEDLKNRRACFIRVLLAAYRRHGIADGHLFGWPLDRDTYQLLGDSIHDIKRGKPDYDPGAPWDPWVPIRPNPEGS